MTASEIEHRLALSGLALEDQEEIRRIFDCLSDTRKLEIFDTWDALILRIQERKRLYEEERALVLTDPLQQLAEWYESYLRSLYHTQTHKNLGHLQTNI